MFNPDSPLFQAAVYGATPESPTIVIDPLLALSHAA